MRGKNLGSDEEEVKMTELQLSYVRSAAKVIAGALAFKGVVDAADVVTLTAVIESLAAAGLGIWAIYQSHKTHA